MIARQGRAGTAVALAVAGSLGFAAAAGANVYCVDTSGGDCTHPGYAGAAGFQTALNDAQANGGADTVRLGGATYTAPSPGGFTHTGGGEVTIDGAGEGATTIAVPAPPADPPGFTQYLGLFLGQPGVDTFVSDLTITLPTPAAPNLNQQYIGLRMAQGEIERVTVDAVATSILAIAIGLDSGRIAASTISLPRGDSASQGLSRFNDTAANLEVVRTSISGQAAISYGSLLGGELTVRRSTLRGGDGSALSLLYGSGSIESSVIEVGSASSSRGLNVGYANNISTTSTLDADGVTIVGSGAGSQGLRVLASDSVGADTATASLTNSIIDAGLDVAIHRQADHGDTANVTTNFSNYDGSSNFSSNGASGSGSTIETNATNLPPGFADPAAGDYHLAPASPLIDIGDAAAPPLDAVDLDGDPRALDGTCPEGDPARRDIGADEVNCDPRTKLTEKPPRRLHARRARFEFVSPDAGSTFGCKRNGDPYEPCDSPEVWKNLANGRHTFRVRAIDPEGNTDPTPAKRRFKVVG